jgi:arylsulfatase A-like enzyme
MPDRFWITFGSPVDMLPNMKSQLLLTLALAVSSTNLRSAETSPAAAKPNILFIAVDDLKPMLGCYGDKEIKSPNLDRLAARGMVFLNNSCQQSVCAPSRASLMTGTYPDTTRVFDLKTQMRAANTNTLTLPEYLRKHGYETTGVGKIYDPRAVDDSFDAPSWSQPFLQNGDKRFVAEGFKDAAGEYQSETVKEANRALKTFLQENGIKRSDKQAFEAVQRKFPKSKPVTECLDVPDDAYNDGQFANCALEQMERLAKGGKPFFLAVGFKKPHLPFVAPKKYWDMYDRAKIDLAPFQKMPTNAPAFAFQDSWEMRSGYSGVPADGAIPDDLQRELIHGYRACVSYTDAQIGKLLDRLEQLGLATNTIVVLWGDHGWHLGDHGMFCKHSNYEQAVRAPLIFAAPQQKAKGAKTSSASEFVDIFPTLCDLIGVPKPKSVEGRSLARVLDDPSAKVREAGMEQYPRNDDKMGYTLRDSRYRYVKWVKMNYYQGERIGTIEATELYDYDKDPLETVNLAAQPEYKEVVAKFERLFKERGVAQAK